MGSSGGEASWVTVVVKKKKMDQHLVSTVLTSSAGRDKVARLLSYSCHLASGSKLLPVSLSVRLSRLAGQLSVWRATRRLADSPLMLRHLYQTGWGGGEEDWLTRWLQIVTNLVDLLYYPVEHIAWAGEHKILPVTPDIWWSQANCLWAISLYLNIGSAIRKVYVLRMKIQGHGKYSKDRARSIEKLEKVQYINIIQAGCDLINAIHWLPAGHLWAGRLSQGRVGLNGFISSIISLYKFVKTVK